MIGKHFETNLSIEKGNIAKMMFLKTADYNYVLARGAFFNNMALDFLWLALHAVEKYLKATLLLNGLSSKNYRHYIEKLYKSVLKIDERIKVGPFVKPGKNNFDWKDESVEEFIKKLNKMGSADNRYLLYGYSTKVADLHKLDQLIWHIRRYCATIIIEFENEEGMQRYDHIQVLENDKLEWRKPNQDLLLERLDIADHLDPRRVDFLTANTAFARDHDHPDIRWMTSAHAPPFSRWLKELSDTSISDEHKHMARKIMTWAIENIQFSKIDICEIKKLIDQK